MGALFSFDTVTKEQLLENKFVAFSVAREEVETFNYERLAFVFSLLKEIKTKAFRKLLITFDGYEDTPEEIFEIDAIKKYMFRLFFNYPHMFYYISTFDLNMKILLACIGDVVKKAEISDNVVKNINDVVYTNKIIAPVKFKYSLPPNVLARIIPAVLSYCNEIGETEEITNQLIDELLNPSLGSNSNLDTYEFLREKKADLFDLFHEISKEMWNAWTKRTPIKIFVGESQIHSFVSNNQGVLLTNISKTKIIRQVAVGEKYTNLFVYKKDSPICEKCGENLALIVKKEIKSENRVHEFLPDISEYIKLELTPLCSEYKENMPIPLDRVFDKKFCIKCKTLSNI